MVLNGIDRILDWAPSLKGARIGVLCNQASLTRDLVHIVDLLWERVPCSLKAIFGPQHGFYGQDQDNMIETPHSIHPIYKVPVYSLYESRREPSSWMLEDLDILLVDLQDVGTRVYTFSSTLLGCMRISAQTGTKLLVLDRPNPVNGMTIDGPILKEGLFSFVGNLPIPLRHGLTLGEIALALKDHYRLDLDLEVIQLKGWKREMSFEDTGLIWHMPSPNMPFTTTALAYTATVLLEATNISEGRGTTRPFEIFGAPFLDPYGLKRALNPRCLEGIVLQEYHFKPTFNKWQGELCHGFTIHVTDKKGFRGSAFIAEVLRAVKELSAKFSWKAPPYEYEHERMPVDIVWGDRNLRECIDNGGEIMDLISSYEQEHKQYLKWREQYLLY